MSKLKKGLCLIFAFILVGCCSAPVKQPPQVIHVPVPVKCEPSAKVEARTDNPTDHITEEMDLYDKVKLMAAELLLVRADNKVLTAALAECTKQP